MPRSAPVMLSGPCRVAARRRCRNTTKPSGSPTTIASSNGEKGDSDVIDAHLKIGDVYKDGDAKQHQQALSGISIRPQDLRGRARQAPGRLRSSAQQGKGVLPDRRIAQGRQRASGRESLLSEGVRSSERPRLAQCAGGGRGAKGARLVPEIKPGGHLHPLGTSRTGSWEPGACAREIAAGRRLR